MPSCNRLLAALSPDGEKALGDVLEPVLLSFKELLIEVDRPIAHVYFPTNGVVSMVNEPNPGEIVEIATIGREGMIGLPVVLGAETASNNAFVQVPGEGFRIEAAAFVQFVEDHPNFRAVLMRYTLALLNQISQSVSCNRLHEVQERCARWLLQTHDRVEGNSFPLTHEFLGQMLGVHRPTVSIAAGMLQRAGLIRYARGTITIIDRAGLEAASCSCYRLIAREYERLAAGRTQT
ncbi:MAG TPA: Crp/Fnr family transcriptional regulator [Stellaceae bacterium]|nr:Crp/Fnr family transcriptional regulator [Stellaceae bacterium]